MIREIILKKLVIFKSNYQYDRGIVLSSLWVRGYVERCFKDSFNKLTELIYM